jgi:membrane-bound ClpP family serine protease
MSNITLPSQPADDEVEPIVAVARTVGGIVLLLVGVVMVVAGAFVYFVPQFITPFTNASEIWTTLENLDIVAALVGGLGLVVIIFAWAFIRRARKRDIGIVILPSDGETADFLDATGTAASGEKPSGTAPPTIL